METLRHSEYRLTMDTHAHVMLETQGEAADEALRPCPPAGGSQDGQSTDGAGRRK